MKKELVDEINRIAAQYIEEIAGNHRYFEDTVMAWKFIPALPHFDPNVVFIPIGLREAASKSNDYIRVFLRPSTFINDISIFEYFFNDTLASWLKFFPGSLRGKQIPFDTILDSGARTNLFETLLQTIIEKNLMDISFKNTQDWFTYLERTTGIDALEPDLVGQFGEHKEIRNVLVHNKGIAGEPYIFKSGEYARFQKDDEIEINDLMLLESKKIGGNID
ncbi:MAG TPA: hypothetical protein DEB39_06160 [Planctomycetaceae bacterium]|nr:hypothetical protein [Planctomycetaceae bacterium]